MPLTSITALRSTLGAELLAMRVKGRNLLQLNNIASFLGEETVAGMCSFKEPFHCPKRKLALKSSW